MANNYVQISPGVAYDLAKQALVKIKLLRDHEVNRLKLEDSLRSTWQKWWFGDVECRIWNARQWYWRTERLCKEIVAAVDAGNAAMFSLDTGDYEGMLNIIEKGVESE